MLVIKYNFFFIYIYEFIHLCYKYKYNNYYQLSVITCLKIIIYTKYIIILCNIKKQIKK